MGIGICVNAASLSSYAVQDLGDGRSALDCAVSFVKTLQQTVPEVAEIIVLLSAEEGESPPPFVFPDAWRRESLAGSGEIDFLDALARVSADYDHVVYLLADTPFLDPRDTGELVKLHREYFAQFTGSDGYPLGSLPEVFEGSFPAALRNLGRENEPVPREIFPIVLRDVNAFDVETMVAGRDVRPLRIDLSCETKQGFELCRRFHDVLGARAEALADFVAEHQERLRILPRFVAIQVVAGHSQRVTYLPQDRAGVSIGSVGEEMPISRFSELVSDLERFSPGIVVQASLWGEIALHSQVVDMLEDMERRVDASFLLETSGVGWSQEARDALVSSPLTRTTIIVDLDAAAEEVYNTLRGEGYAEATGFARALLNAHPDRVYVRATRMRENAEDIETFYRRWKEETDNVIIRKYDHFAGELPDRRLVDISPMERLPCWHLKRDLYVLLDGRVPMCREDLSEKHPLGNVFQEGVAELWRRNEEFYQRHVGRDYPSLCQNCDEYYTFNF